MALGDALRDEVDAEAEFFGVVLGVRGEPVAVARADFESEGGAIAEGVGKFGAEFFNIRRAKVVGPFFTEDFCSSWHVGKLKFSGRVGKVTRGQGGW